MKRKPHFDGADIQPARDDPRLTRQIARILALISDGEWRSLDSIAKATNSPHASVSAQLRNLRKPRFGGYKINRRYVSDGLYHYRLAPKGERT